jgi:succinate-acetate transporter protein
MNSVPDARVFLRPIGSPLSMGMAGLGIASLIQSGYDLRWVAGSEALKVGLILIAVPFVLQGVATIFAYLARDGTAGYALGVLATSWSAIGLVHVASQADRRSGALGLMLLASAGMLALAAVSAAGAKPLPAAVFGVEGLRFAIAGIYELGGASFWRDIAGVGGLVVVVAAAYCALAFALEDQHRRPVLPTLRRGRGRAALVGAATEALDDLLHDPGVRQTT